MFPFLHILVQLLLGGMIGVELVDKADLPRLAR
jgi:hypothetical protein